MIVYHNWDVCPNWVTFSSECHLAHSNSHCRDIRRHNHNWDVCPGWVRFSLDRRERRRNISVVEEIRKDDEEEEEEKEKRRPIEVTGEAIPLPNGNHFHRICARSDVFDHEREEARTGPAIRIGKRQHIHMIKRKKHD